jgi:hypothetical protein
LVVRIIASPNRRGVFKLEGNLIFVPLSERI